MSNLMDTLEEQYTNNSDELDKLTRLNVYLAGAKAMQALLQSSINDLQSRVAEIRARADAATPGPWHIEKRGEWHNGKLQPNAIICPDGRLFDLHLGQYSCVRWADAELMAHARADIPWLLDLNARLTKRLEQALMIEGVFIPTMYESIDEYIVAELAKVRGEK